MQTWIFLLLGIVLTAILSFVVFLFQRGLTELLHKLYCVVSISTVIWIMAVMSLYFIGDNMDALRIADSVMNVGMILPVVALLITLTFIYDWHTLPKQMYLLFIIPLISFLMVWTNPLHHFYYINFSADMSQIKFGWFFYVYVVYSYLCTFLSIILILVFTRSSKSHLYVRQSLLIAFGNLLPLVANLLVTMNIFPNNSYIVTPLSYSIGVILCHGIAIFKLHLFDIRPLAATTVLNWISDCYLVLNAERTVVNFNKAFADVFGRGYGVAEGEQLDSFVSQDIKDNGFGLYTLISALETCNRTNSTLSYEQAITTVNDGVAVRKYYIVDITPLNFKNRLVGHVIFFKDVSKLKESMQKLQSSQAHLMEQERLAFLGQMVGGIAHNLKTPIMGISGCTLSVDKLIDEGADSLGDPEVTSDDYREIFGEMRSWMVRIREACTYMSDIITAVKGQAASFNNSSGAGSFTVEDVYKRAMLLMRHELVGNNCTLSLIKNFNEPALIRGDINSMVQIINNLVGNAVDASRSKGGGKIEMLVEHDDSHLMIKIKDYGSGIPEDVKKLLFKQMVTSKGTMGTGIGIFISNTIIKAKFDGSMWFEDNPEGGTIFGLSIPFDFVTINAQPTDAQLESLADERVTQ